MGKDWHSTCDLSNAVIVINKPPGHSSHEITTFVKKITGASRAGHAGTLDPEVSGVLPIALGKATKLLRYIAGKDKTYVGIIKFRKTLSEEEIKKLFDQFTGELIQTPPKISAVRKVARKRTIHKLELLEARGRLALFETNVDAGTYIRTLCEDMGKTCGGARMEELRRIAVGGIEEKTAHTMQDLIDAVWLARNTRDETMLLSLLEKPERFIELPRVQIKATALNAVMSGAQITLPGIEEMDERIRVGERVAIYCRDKFVGVGIMKSPASDLKQMNQGRLHGIAISLERVHIQKG